MELSYTELGCTCEVCRQPCTSKQRHTGTDTNNEYMYILVTSDLIRQVSWHSCFNEYSVLQGPTAFHEKLVSENTQHFKLALQQLAGHSKDWNDRLGDQADSLRAYLEDKRESTHATFKDSQVTCHNL